MSNIVIPNGGNIGSASDTDAISISSSGAVTLSSDFVPATPLSNRNMIINGAMTVAQRATTKANEGDQGYLTVDRFMDTRNGMGAEMNFYQADDAPTGFKKSWKITNVGDEASLGSGDHFYLRHKIEGQDLQHLKYGTSSAETITLSFWVRSTVTGTGCVVFFMDGNKQYSTSYTISSSDTWEKKEITIAGNTSTAITNTNAMGMEINWFLCAGSDYTSGSLSNAWENSTLANRAVGQTNFVGGAAGRHFAITGVQLELGSVATPFEHRSYGDELARCKRYYQEVFGNGHAVNATAVWFLDGTNWSMNMHLPKEMRATATATVVGTGVNTSGGSSQTDKWALYVNGGWKGCSSISVTSISAATFRLDGQVNNSVSGGNAGGLYNGTACYIKLSAEL